MAKRPFEFTLGRLVMNFGALEFSIIRGVAELLPFLPTELRTEKVETSFGPMLGKYGNFVKRLIHDPVLLEAHGDLIEKLTELKNKRNDSIHGAWFDVPGSDIDAEKAKLLRHATLGDLMKPNQHAKFITPASIIETSNRVNEASSRLAAHRAAVLASISHQLAPPKTPLP